MPVDVRVDHGIGQQHVVDDFPELVNAGMRQGLVAAELDAPERGPGVGGCCRDGGSGRVGLASYRSRPKDHARRGAEVRFRAAAVDEAGRAVNLQRVRIGGDLRALCPRARKISAMQLTSAVAIPRLLYDQTPSPGSTKNNGHGQGDRTSMRSC